MKPLHILLIGIAAFLCSCGQKSAEGKKLVVGFCPHGGLNTATDHPMALRWLLAVPPVGKQGQRRHNHRGPNRENAHRKEFSQYKLMHDRERSVTGRSPTSQMRRRAVTFGPFEIRTRTSQKFCALRTPDLVRVT